MPWPCTHISAPTESRAPVVSDHVDEVEKSEEKA